MRYDCMRNSSSEPQKEMETPKEWMKRYGEFTQWITTQLPKPIKS